MSSRLTTVLLTVVAFGLGYVAARSGQTVPSVPAPPSISLLDDQKNRDAEELRPIDRARIIAEVDALRPHITAYCLRVEEIEADFRLEFVNLLTAQQVKNYEANQNKFARQGNHSTQRVSEDIERERDRSLNSVYWLVTVTPKLTWLSKEYRLDANQQMRTRALLTMRRNAFLALLDGTTHPSLRLSRVAQMVDRIRNEAPK